MTETKQRLIVVLEQIAKRYSSMFFSKLVLLQEETEPQQTYIRHYDIQCEAVQTLADTLNTKIKAIKFKCFYLIKFFRKDQLLRRKTRTQNASYIHNFSSGGSYYQRNNGVKNMKDRLRLPNTTRHDQTFRTGFDRTSQMFSDIDYSMSALMRKMKDLNRRIPGQYSNIDPQSPNQSDKLMKRKLILSKLTELEHNISQLIVQEQQKQKINHLTSSQITLRNKPLLEDRNYHRKTRQINRTFCVEREHIF